MFDIESPSQNESSFGNGAKIIVIGVGGGGCNAVNTMIREGLTGVKYVVANTDSQALNASMSEKKIQLGTEVTKGLGAGANPEIGKQAAMEDYDQIAETLKDADMVFITAGMGGGTGTGAAPVIAKLSRDLGALTVGVVTKPFRFEGKKRKRQAEAGILELESSVDSLITIPNEKLLELAGEDLTLVDTFRKADGVLLNAVRGITDLINNTGLINADFADVATVMANKGLALMGTGLATGPDRAIMAAKEAINSPLLDEVSIEGATGIIVNISGDSLLTTSETNKAMNLIMDEADEDAEIIFGTVIDEALGDAVKVTVIATGLGENNGAYQQGQAKTQAQTPRPTLNYQRKSSERLMEKQSEEEVVPASNFNTSAYAEVGSGFSAANVAKVQEPANMHEASSPSSTSSTIKEEEADAFLDQSFSSFNDSDVDTSENHDIEQEQLTESGDEIQAMSESESINNTEENDQDDETNEEVRGFGRAKRIAQKLGFMNFDDEDFDKPAHERGTRKESDH